MRHPGSVPGIASPTCWQAPQLSRCVAARFERSIFCPDRREQPRTKRAAAHKLFYARVLKAAVRAGAALTPLAKRFGIVESGSGLVGRKEARARVQSGHGWRIKSRPITRVFLSHAQTPRWRRAITAQRASIDPRGADARRHHASVSQHPARMRSKRASTIGASPAGPGAASNRPH